jgi:hypothetical protein
MPEYLAPGVYIEEQDAQQPIEGVSTSVTGFVGVTQRGPLDTLPAVLVTSIPDFERTFGEYFTPNFSPAPPANSAPLNMLPYAVAGFFNNGGKLLYIKRVASKTNPPVTAAAVNLENNAVGPTLITRLSSNANAGATTLQLASLRGIQNGSTLVLTQVKNGITTTSPTLTVASYDDASGQVTLTAALPAAPPAAYEAQYTTVAVSGGAGFLPAPNTTNFALQAVDPGVWGNDIAVQITPSARPVAQAQVIADVGNASPGTNNLLVLNSASNFYAAAIIEINTTTANATSPQKFYAKIESVSGSGIVLTASLGAPQVAAIAANLAAAPAVPVWVRTCEFDVSASDGTTQESFRGLTLDNTTANFYATAIVNGSSLLSVPQPFPSDQTATDPSTVPIALDGLNLALTGGTDGGAPDSLDFVGEDLGPGDRTGIQALIDVSEISIIGAPGITDQQTQNELIVQCENLKYRFAILDPGPSATGGTPSLSDIQNQRKLYDTKYAAIYYPRLIVDDPLTGNPLAIPPSGHMAGIYAQTDDSRGVWKAPANVVIRGITDLELKVSKGEQEILNPEPDNICVLRDFRAQGRGLRVYGARCITSLTEWKYINVRRLFIFLEASLDLGTQWAVFEPNDEILWNRLIQSVSAFLTTVWREGGLMGSKPEEAFFVKCGYNTMSLDDRENGRLIMLVGVAPVYPAEFVIIRIGQWAGGSSVQEL